MQSVPWIHRQELHILSVTQAFNIHDVLVKGKSLQPEPQSGNLGQDAWWQWDNDCRAPDNNYNALTSALCRDALGRMVIVLCLLWTHWGAFQRQNSEGAFSTRWA